MKNIKTIISTMLILALFASVSFAAKPVRIIVTGTLYQLDIPYTGKLDQNAKIYLGNFSSPLTWSQSGKGADVFVDLPEGISAGTYVLKMAGQKREIAIGPFIAETGLTNRINTEVTRANTAETGLTNRINTEVTRANTAETGLTNAINNEVTRANTAETGLTNAINNLSNTVTNNFNTLNNNINSTSNSLANLSSNLNFKAFMSYKTTIGDTSTVAFASSLVFSNLATADAYSTWTTNNGASFQAPVTGTYQINFVTDIYESYSWGADYYQFSIYNTPVSGSPFSISDNYWRTSGQHASYVLIQLNQGDSISVANTSPYSAAVSLYSASLSIVQVQ